MAEFSEVLLELEDLSQPPYEEYLIYTQTLICWNFSRRLLKPSLYMEVSFTLNIFYRNMSIALLFFSVSQNTHQSFTMVVNEDFFSVGDLILTVLTEWSFTDCELPFLI